MDAPVQQLTPDHRDVSEAFGDLNCKNPQCVRSEQHKNRRILPWKEGRAGMVRSERRVNQRTDSQKPKIISLVDI